MVIDITSPEISRTELGLRGVCSWFEGTDETAGLKKNY